MSALGAARVWSAEFACAAWRLCVRLYGEPPWDDDARRYREPLPLLFRVLYAPCHALHMRLYRAAPPTTRSEP